MDQEECSKNLKEVTINDAENDERDLTKEEQSTLRSQLGGLLWLAATRLDLVADIGLLQSYVTKSKVKHLKAANMVVEKAKDPQFQELGLIYQRFLPDSFLAIDVHSRCKCSIKAARLCTRGRAVITC